MHSAGARICGDGGHGSAAPVLGYFFDTLGTPVLFLHASALSPGCSALFHAMRQRQKHLGLGVTVL